MSSRDHEALLSSLSDNLQSYAQTSDENKAHLSQTLTNHRNDIVDIFGGTISKHPFVHWLHEW